MPMYPYMINTKWGWTFPYDTETNVSAFMPANSLCLLHQPAPLTRTAKRAVIVQPVIGVSGELMFANGETASLAEIQHLFDTQIGTTNGIPIFMGYPIDERDVVDKKNITTTTLPGLAPPVYVIVVLVVVMLFAVGMFILPPILDHLRKLHEFDMALQAQEVVSKTYIDVDTGESSDEFFEGADVERREYRNGEGVDVALNDRGKEFLGDNVSVWREGIDMEDLIALIEQEKWAERIKWIAIAAVAIGGVYVAAKVLPGMLEKNPNPGR